MKRLILFNALFSASLSLVANQPNIVLIGIDDLNDWVGCMGGHPQAQTPNIDRLASRGVLFTNAVCQSPVCNPSRASLMSSIYPETSGLYFLAPSPAEAPLLMEQPFMPETFEDAGYHVSGAGKLFHADQSEKFVPNYAGRMGGFGPIPKEKISSFPGHPLWDWGVFPEHDEEMPDFKIATWASDQLAQQMDQPYWLGVGFFRPHVPQYAPQKWFDLYPMETLQLPKTIPDDLEDLSSYGIDLTRLEHVSPTMEWVLENDEWKPLVQSYLACVSFVDDQLGRVLDAIEKRDDADNTFIVLFSDHGFHLGEKERFAKRSLWRDGVGTPLIIVGPGIDGGKVCDQPVQLLDIFPTLLDLTGLDPVPSHEGRSLRPLLEDPNREWPFMARTSFGPGNVALSSKDYRYIHYNDGTEELYHRKNDPHEWNNLASLPEMKAILEHHRQQLPDSYKPALEGKSTGHQTFDAAENNRRK